MDGVCTNSGIIMNTYYVQGPRSGAVGKGKPALIRIFGLISWLRGQEDVHGVAWSHHELGRGSAWTGGCGEEASRCAHGAGRCPQELVQSSHVWQIRLKGA